MSFWNGLKHALGFSHESEEDEEDYSSALPTYAVTPPPVPATLPVTSPDAEAAGPETIPVAAGGEIEDSALPADLFDSVIEVFNASQPEFVKSCLSVESQRAYIMERISDSLRKRIVAARLEMTEEETRIKNESMREDARRADRLSAENNKLRLSLDRQKRALLDRINDLEAQVAKLHTDRDRFYIDKHNPADAEIIAKGSERIALLEAEVAGLTAKLETKPEQTSQNERIAELEKELARQTALKEQLEVKSRISDEILSELRNTVAKTRVELEHVTEEREEATQYLSEQLDSFEKVKKKLEAKVKELQEKLEAEKRDDKDGRIAKLNEENASLRHTIENNLYNQANSEMRLRKEIKQLSGRVKELEQAVSMTEPAEIQAAEPESESDTAATATQPAPRRRGRPKKVRADADLDNADWFAGAKKDDPDFGYHEPPRRPVNDNEAQLSLF